MLFSTPFFLFIFLPVFFALYWFLPKRRWMLLLGSLFFYGWGEPIFLLVVLASALLDWLLGRRIAQRRPGARGWVALGVVANLGLLVYAKYTVFAVLNINAIGAMQGWRAWPVPHIALPLGVSFIVFEKITYVVDLYRKVAPPARSFLDYLNYVFLFPKLLAGPIVKYHDIAPQLARPSPQFSEIKEGLLRFIFGLGKKVLIADSLAPVVDQVFSLPPGALNPGTAWLGLACFTLQIFFDFSGYSDMAIGMARMLGFRLMENFRDPYLAESVTDFWRRWHISLSTWIKEYVYIPLGGNRVSTARAYANLCLCFILTGLWHGAAWNFVIWGSLHGVALVCERAFWLRLSAALPRFVRVGVTFGGVAVAWVFFRCDTFGRALQFLRALVGGTAAEANEVFLRPDTILVLLVGALLVLKPIVGFSAQPIVDRKWQLPGLAWAFLLLVLCLGRISVNSFQPFLYFRF
ncbi:MAG: MBOAT family O-acyltransferase [Chthoniobacterales bacterium]